MGLFDKVLGKDGGEIKLDKKEAFGAVAVAAVASDGEVSPEEVQRVAIDLMTLKAFRKADLRDLSNILNKVAGLIKKRGIGPVLQAAKASLSKDELGAAFFVAVDLVLADGVVEEDEKKFLEELQRHHRNGRRYRHQDRRSRGHQEQGLILPGVLKTKSGPVGNRQARITSVSWTGRHAIGMAVPVALAMSFPS